MTAFPTIVLSDVASVLHHGFTSNIAVLSTGTILKPQNTITSGKAASYSYNSTTGLFTLDSSKRYQVEADLVIQATAMEFQVVLGFTDSGGTELPMSARGRNGGTEPANYYAQYSLTADETAFAVIDGSVTASFYWKIISLAQDAPGQVAADGQTYTNWDGYYGTRSRLLIKEY